MRIKKNSIKAVLLLVFLFVVLGITAYKFLGPGAEDINKAKAFMEKLYSINAVNTDMNLSDIKYEKVKSGNNKTELTYSTIVTQFYGIDLDKENDVIGFAKKDTQPNVVKIEPAKAQDLAQTYLQSIYDGDIVLKSVKNTEDLPYYSFIFTKEKYGYPFYFDEIKVNINKENGFLDGYSNMAIHTSEKEPKIDISEDEAKEAAINAFKSYNGEGTINESVSLVYASNKIEKTADSIEEICYMVTVDGKDADGQKISWKIFINASDESVFNILKNGAEKEVTTKKSDA